VSLLRRYQTALLEATLLVKLGYLLVLQSTDCVYYIVFFDEEFTWFIWEETPI